MFFFLWVNHTLGQGTGYYHIIFHLLYSKAVNNVRNRRSLVRRVHKRVFIDIVWQIHYELKYLPFSLRTLWLRVVLYFKNLITNILFIPYQFTKSPVTKPISPVYYLSLSITYLLNHFITWLCFQLKRIKFREICEFWWILLKLVPRKTIKKLSMHEIREI